MAFVRRKDRKFYIVTSVRTAAGPRQRCEYVASGPMSCRTLQELQKYLIAKHKNRSNQLPKLIKARVEKIKAAIRIDTTCRAKRFELPYRMAHRRGAPTPEEIEEIERYISSASLSADESP